MERFSTEGIILSQGDYGDFEDEKEFQPTKGDLMELIRNCGLYVTLMLLLLCAAVINPISIWIFLGVLVATGVAYTMIRLDKEKMEEDNAEKTEK